MPRLQSARRISLLSTGLRSVFLEAFMRQASQEGGQPQALELGEIARRVQVDIQRATGRYFPLHQLVLTMHDLRHDSEYQSPRELSPQDILETPAIEVTAPSLNSSMSRRRIGLNIPALQCQLAIPPPVFSFSLSPTSETPSSITPTSCLLFGLPRRHSLSSGIRTRSPITPIEQILHTPPSPPKLPRFAPARPRDWTRLNVQARMGETSPLESPSLPIASHMLNAAGKPFLKPLQIPGTMMAGDPELRDIRPSPSPGALSPFDLSKSPFFGSVLVESARPVAARTNSSSNLARTALLRTSRPSLARSFSHGRAQDSFTKGDAERTVSPLSPFGGSGLVSPISGQALASPFVIYSETIDGSYFSRV